MTDFLFNSLLNYDGYKNIPEFAWKTIKNIRDNIFEFIIQEPENNYVLTNVLNEDEGDHNLFKQVENMAFKRNSLFVPIKLLISEEENNKRIQSPERVQRYKSLRIEQGLPLINIIHPNLLELDVNALHPSEAAGEILEHVNTIQKSLF